MTNSEFLEEMMFHIHESYLINDFEKKIKKIHDDYPNLEYHEKVFEVYNSFKQNGKLKNFNLSNQR
jgi:hypothetical protein